MLLAVTQQCRQRHFLVIRKLVWTASNYVFHMLYQCRWVQVDAGSETTAVLNDSAVSNDFDMLLSSFLQQLM